MSLCQVPWSFTGYISLCAGSLSLGQSSTEWAVGSPVISFISVIGSFALVATGVVSSVVTALWTGLCTGCSVPR